MRKRVRSKRCLSPGTTIPPPSAAASRPSRPSRPGSSPASSATGWWTSPSGSPVRSNSPPWGRSWRWGSWWGGRWRFGPGDSTTGAWCRTSGGRLSAGTGCSRARPLRESLRPMNDLKAAQASCGREAGVRGRADRGQGRVRSGLGRRRRHASSTTGSAGELRHPQSHGLDPGERPAGPAASVSPSMSPGRRGGRRSDLRLPLLFWPEPTGKWINVDRWPDSQARRRARLFRTLDALNPADLNANPGATAARPTSGLTPGPDALRRLVRLPRKHPAPPVRRDPLVESHLAKYRKLVPAASPCSSTWPTSSTRPAGSTGSAEVSRPSVEKAIQWSELLEGHARRVYGSLDAPDLEAALGSIHQALRRATDGPFLIS